MSPTENYLWDTNTTIFFLYNLSPEIMKKYRQLKGRIAISTISVAEVYRGLKNTKDKALRRTKIKQFEEFLKAAEVLDFKLLEAIDFGNIYAQAQLKGQRLKGGELDLMIAATARVNKLTLVTDNTKHFTDIPHLKVVNWMQR